MLLGGLSREAGAAGISRSTGLGFKISFWNLTNHPTRISTSNYGENADISIGGVGVWINFHSRLKRNWFMEFKLGAVGSVEAKQTDYVVKTQEVSSIVPVLLGIRYDLITEQMPSSIVPYLNGGLGIYGMTEITTTDDFSSEQVIESTSKYGSYFGGGAHLVVTNWFAFNVDLRYQFVDFKFEKGYSGMEFGVGTTFMWGSRREIFHIESIKVVVKDIYPAYYHLYSMIPIVLVTVKNTADYPIEVNIRSHIRRYSERAHETGYTKIARGATEDIPVHAIFGSKLLNASLREPAVIDLSIEARSGTQHNKNMSVQVMVHSKNAWDGDSKKLSAFVTPDEPRILETARELEKQMADGGHGELRDFKLAEHFFNALERENIRYLSDPNVPYYQDDRVQFARETLNLKTGDCDDLVVLYASLLESVGIHTAFVDVRDPEETMAHLYLLFDSGVSAENAAAISTNKKRYIIREEQGKRTVWIPVETTLIGEGFRAAWEDAALSFLRQGEIRGGLANGWVEIIDVN
jgi:opacity protein-like surface antigen